MSPDPSGSSGRKGEQDAWGAFGLMVSGVAVWGGVGWLLSEWLDNRVFLMVGLLVGMSAALYLVWFKYGRS
jgi:F0F1-type ATP synthase assembly protein I